MKTRAWQIPNATLRARKPATTRVTPAFWPSASKRFFQNLSATSAPRPAERWIYVVDDEEGLPELYTHFLKGMGFVVRAFNLRAAALAALTAESRKPDLLITDYCGRSMPVDRFVHQCRAVHPTLRILMASGFSQTDMQFCRAIPDRFIQKPFTADEFLREVRTTLAAQ